MSRSTAAAAALLARRRRATRSPLTTIARALFVCCSPSFANCDGPTRSYTEYVDVVVSEALRLQVRWVCASLRALAHAPSQGAIDTDTPLLLSIRYKMSLVTAHRRSPPIVAHSPGCRSIRRRRSGLPRRRA